MKSPSSPLGRSALPVTDARSQPATESIPSLKAEKEAEESERRRQIAAGRLEAERLAQEAMLKARSMQQSIQLDRAARYEGSSKSTEVQPGSPLRGGGYSPLPGTASRRASDSTPLTNSPVSSPLVRNGGASPLVRNGGASPLVRGGGGAREGGGGSAGSAGNSSPLVGLAPPVDQAVAFLGRFFGEPSGDTPPPGALSPAAAGGAAARPPPFQPPQGTPAEADSPSRPLAPPPPPAWAGAATRWEGGDLAPGEAILF